MVFCLFLSYFLGVVLSLFFCYLLMFFFYFNVSSIHSFSPMPILPNQLLCF